MTHPTRLTIPDVTDTLLREMVSKIVKHFHPDKIILFGSRAWGEPTRESDLDLLVVMNIDGFFDWNDGSRGMDRVCTDRHHGSVHILFMDMSGNSVGLKELWQLEWHPNYEPPDPAPVWPQWIEDAVK